MRIYMYDDEERGGRHDADEGIAGRVFSSQEECGAFVAQLLAGELPGEIAQHVAARLATRCKDKQVPALGIAFRINRWVIRQEDLGFFNVLRTAALAGLAAVSGASAAAPVVGALAAAAETGWNLWRKGVKLEEVDLRVLQLLEEAEGGLAAGDIAKRLSAKGTRWSTKSVEQVLGRLSKLNAHSGTVAVVHQSSDGKWRPSH
jgi:hypothetical protein